MSETISRLEAVRSWLKNNDFSALIIPGTDPHQSEYIAPYFKAREFVSGFAGSQGTLVVTLERAALFTDSRYWLDAEQVLSSTGIELMKVENPRKNYTIPWITEALQGPHKIAIDGLLIAKSDFDEWAKLLLINQIVLSIIPDPFKDIWTDRPEMPNSKLMLFSPSYKISSVEDKLEQIELYMEANNYDWYLVSALDEMAWLLNIRANDIPFVPVPYAWFLVGRHGSTLFIDESRVGNEFRDILSELNIGLSPYHTLGPHLQTLAPRDLIFASKDGLSEQVFESMSHMIVETGMSVISDWKSVKTDAELDAFRRAHIMDACAMLNVYLFINKAISEDKKIDEIDIENQIKNERASFKEYCGESFASIIASGANGSIVHYSAKQKTAAKISKKNLLLIDSGGHFDGATTDATRVLSFAEPSKAQTKAYTLVLKGHIALSNAIFPEGTNGQQLDILARQYLWQEGLNYGHGTGHGVGAYLSVHEGPQRISPSAAPVVLKPGMIITNEPGYYEAGQFGIRIENVLIVKKHSKLNGYLCFEPITLLPYNKKLIDEGLLSEKEKAWIENYHAHAISVLGSNISQEMKELFN